MRHLPDVADAASFERLERLDPRLVAGVAHLARRHGMAGARVERFPEGSLPVFAVGTNAVLKLYPPCYVHEEPIETSVLRAIDGRIGIPTPRVLAVGDLDGWRYLLMSRLPGVSLVQAWPSLSPRQREERMADLGRALARLHATPTDGVAAPRPAWPSFLRERAAGAVAEQRARGLDERWVEQIPAFLEREMPPPDAPPVLLHTEVMREHLLAGTTDDGFPLTGLVDFEPSMIGAAEYEFASVGVFATCGEPGLLRALLLAYGYGERDLQPALARRFLAYALLHRYSNLAWYLRRLPPPPAVRTLDALAETWWC
jgi:hygromycin-B 7''-O-kinase